MIEPPPFKTTMQFTYGEPLAMAPGVVRIVANNPSPFTYKGTNTYMVGAGELAVIDPGPNDPAHLEAILKAAPGRAITHIVLTHTHHDHLDGLAALKVATGAVTCGYGRTVATPGRRRRSPAGDEYVDADFHPDLVLRDGDAVSGPDWTLRALHTPGHAPDHLCFALDGTGILFSGDHVMAWSTSVVAPPEGRMADYLASLERLLARDDRLYLPGHGGRLDEPRRLVRAFLVHRRWREEAILEAIKTGHATIEEMVETVYRGIDDHLVAAASLSVRAHVEHLMERGLVTGDAPAPSARRFSAA